MPPYERNKPVEATETANIAVPELNEAQEKMVELFSAMQGHQKGEYVTFGALEELLVKLSSR